MAEIWASWVIDYLLDEVTQVEGTKVALLGPTTRSIFKPNKIEGFGIARGKPLVTTGPAMRVSKVREVQVEVPQEMIISGHFLSSAQETNIRNYSKKLDYLAGEQTDGSWRQGIIRYQDALGVVLYRTAVPTSLSLPRDVTLGSRARQFELIFESYDPVWKSAIQQQNIASGNNTVTVNGSRAVYPIIELTAGASFANVTIKSTTHANRQLVLTNTFTAGQVIVITMDPQSDVDLVKVGTVNYQQYLGQTDKRWKLFPGSNTVNIAYSGTLTSGTIKWQDIYPAV